MKTTISSGRQVDYQFLNWSSPFRAVIWGFLSVCWSSSGVPLFQLPQQIWASVLRPVRNRLISWGPPSTKTHLDTHREWNLHYTPLERETDLCSLRKLIGKKVFCLAGKKAPKQRIRSRPGAVQWNFLLCDIEMAGILQYLGSSLCCHRLRWFSVRQRFDRPRVEWHVNHLFKFNNSFSFIAMSYYKKRPEKFWKQKQPVKYQRILPTIHAIVSSLISVSSIHSSICPPHHLSAGLSQPCL